MNLNTDALHHCRSDAGQLFHFNHLIFTPTFIPMSKVKPKATHSSNACNSNQCFTSSPCINTFFLHEKLNRLLCQSLKYNKNNFALKSGNFPTFNDSKLVPVKYHVYISFLHMKEYPIVIKLDFEFMMNQFTTGT